jgi:hypothetical protein
MSQRRQDGSWSAPAYAEVGVVALVSRSACKPASARFTDEDGIKGIFKGKVQLGAKTLNRVCNSWLLRNEGLSQRRRPIRMLSHHVEDVWIMSDRLYGDIPILTFDTILIHPAA